MLTEEQLIEQLKALKAIKPKPEWANLLLSQITSEEPIVQAPVRTASWMSFMAPVRMAYSLAAFMFIVAGVFSFANHTVPGDTLFPIKKLAEQSQASLLGRSQVTQDIVTLNNRVHDLAQATKEGKKENIPSVLGEIKVNASELAQAVKENAVNKDAIKEIASTLRTLSNVSSQETTVSADEDVASLYETVAKNQLEELKQGTLTEAQQEEVRKADQLYREQRYAEALQVILLIHS